MNLGQVLDGVEGLGYEALVEYSEGPDMDTTLNFEVDRGMFFISAKVDYDYLESLLPGDDPQDDEDWDDDDDDWDDGGDPFGFGDQNADRDLSEQLGMEVDGFTVFRSFGTSGGVEKWTTSVNDALRCFLVMARYRGTDHRELNALLARSGF